MKKSFFLFFVFFICMVNGYGASRDSGQSLKEATFAGGCFWCMEASFEHLSGVLSVDSGYTGGHVKEPSYHSVSSGETGHTEAIRVLYDPKQVSYEELLDVFWHNIDPTTADRQFSDIGEQYRTAIYYHDEEQKNLALESKQKIEKLGIFDSPVVTEIVPASDFFPAEEHHQDFYKKNPVRYKAYKLASGRARFFKQVWGK